MDQGAPSISFLLKYDNRLIIFVEHHGKQLMLLKKGSKPANKGFKRKKLDVKGTYAQIKGGSSQQLMPGGGNQT
jgi:hypothetical protein